MSDTPLLIPETDVLGHAAFTDALAQSMASGRVAHGWLLTGPQGIGKSVMACMAAAWLLSESRPEGQGFALDRSDPGANLVIRGSHPDLLLVRPQAEDNKSGQIKIDQIRKVASFMANKPGRGGWRVAIIDSMDAVNRNGANALLKLLEEPPERAMLILVASRPGRLPPTIRSRCRLVRLAPLDTESCQAILAAQLGDEQDGRVANLARLAEGSPGRGMALAASQSDDLYQAVCSLMAQPRLDESAVAALCDKWGRGGAAGQAARDGAIWLIGRLLRLAALQAGSGETASQCDFETPAVARLLERHAAADLAEAHASFLRTGAQMDGLYLDFGHFLSRELIAIHRKSLP
ncbi:MAG: DNA polymerase III subunit delta' [Candidatus Puniceispirillaceae bacterium]